MTRKLLRKIYFKKCKANELTTEWFRRFNIVFLKFLGEK